MNNCYPKRSSKPKQETTSTIIIKMQSFTRIIVVLVQPFQKTVKPPFSMGTVYLNN